MIIQFEIGTVSSVGKGVENISRVCFCIVIVITCTTVIYNKWFWQLIHYIWYLHKLQSHTLISMYNKEDTIK